MKNIGIIKKSHLASILHSEKISERNETYLDELLDSLYYEIEIIEDSDILIDFDTLEIYDTNHIKNFKHDIESLKINKLNFEECLPENSINIETLCIHADYINTILEDPKSDKYDIAIELYNEYQLSKFSKNIIDRQANEIKIKQLQRKILPTNDTFLNRNFVEYIKVAKIRNLELGWLPLNNEDINTLNKIKSLDTLTLQYNYNYTFNNISNIKVNELTIYGNSLSEIPNFKKNTTIKFLNLDGNSISYIDFEKLPQSLNYLTIDNNLISEIDLSNINSKIESLSLNDNIITKLICNDVNNNLQHLSLRNNNLIINEAFYHLIDLMFPNLEYIDLRGNKFQDRFGIEFIDSNTNDNQLIIIKEYLNIIDTPYPIINNDIEFKQFTNYITLTWSHNNAPFLLIIKNLQYQLEDYLKEITNKIFHAYGVYFCILNKITINITYSENKLILSLSSDSEFILTDYYFKYLNLIYNEIEYRSDLKIIPTIDTSTKMRKSVNYLMKIYGLDQNFGISKKINIIKIESNCKPQLLVLNNKSIATHYIKIDEVAFIIITSKTASIYCLSDKKEIYNTTEIFKKNKQCFELILRTSDDKENFKKALTNPYLDKNQFLESFIYIDNDMKKKVNILINSNHFSIDESNILSKNSIIIHPQLIINELHKVTINDNILSFTS